MPGSKDHDKIAEMAGISSAISEEINRFMDDMNPPEDAEAAVEKIVTELDGLGLL